MGNFYEVKCVCLVVKWVLEVCKDETGELFEVISLEFYVE